MGLDTKTDWLTDRQSQCDFDFDYDFDFQPLRHRIDYDFDSGLDGSSAVYGRLRSGWTAGLFTQRVTHKGAGIEFRFLLVVHLPAGPLVTK
jgi:hypothetical protein